MSGCSQQLTEDENGRNGSRVDLDLDWEGHWGCL